MTKIKSALVTGASSGLGRELTRQLVRQHGARVFTTARRLDRLESLRDELPPGAVSILPGDIADADFRRSLWSWAERESGGIDLLINNAGVGHYAEFVEQDDDRIRAVLEINVNALLHLTRLAAGDMKRRGGGEIVQISSVLGEIGFPYSTVYVVSKHAVNGLVKSLKHELHGTGVKVWAACPGRFASEFRTAASDGRIEKETALGTEPTDRVARGILRGLNRGRTLHYPTWRAWALVRIIGLMPWAYDRFMRSWTRAHVRGEDLPADPT